MKRGLAFADYGTTRLEVCPWFAIVFARSQFAQRKAKGRRFRRWPSVTELARPVEAVSVLCPGAAASTLARPLGRNKARQPMPMDGSRRKSRKAAGASGFNPGDGMGESGGAAADLFSKRTRPVAAIHYRNRSDSSNLDIKLGRVIGGWQWRAADRRCASRCGHSSRRASGLGVAFVGALCRRIDSQGVDPRSLNWKISSPGRARDRIPLP